MKKVGLCSLVALLLGLTVLVAEIPAAGAPPAGAEAETPTLMVDGRLQELSSPLRWDKDSIIVPLEELAGYLAANFQWNEAEGTTWIQKYGRTIFFRLATGEIRKNSEPVSAPVPARLINGRFYVPLRFVAENLGTTVIWDGDARQVQIITGERHIPPERISSKTFDAVVAYTDQGNLWLLDGREPDALPKQQTDAGFVELVGWSFDGAWLAYKHASDEYAPAYLWVVGADGGRARQVDTEPVGDDQLWSPESNRIAYTVKQENIDDYIPTGTVKCAEISAEEIQVNTLVEEDVVMIPALAWHPDGESLAISLPRTKDQPPRLEQVDLAAERKVLYTLEEEAAPDLETLYPWALISLKWSPDGRYLAYHLRLNSASLTADVVETGVLNVENGQLINLNSGLRYPQWMSFSPDSAKLAYIAGIGRDVIHNKWLELADLASGRLTDHSQNSFADAQPKWLPGNPQELLFCRGPEAKTISDFYALPGVLLPGQRIYKLDYKGNSRAVTAGPPSTADYYPSPSPSGEEMLFLRLERYDQGSLYLQPVDTPEDAMEILRGLRGGPGYYGNYYPEWISVYWF
ncbi:MAG: copper amine oxidase [Firmicutes bacterium]|nr:copper amine oxidase [Bacillota bacterium]